MFRDFALAFRTLRRAKSFTVLVVLTLALGIGATTTMVSLVNAILLRGLPYKDAERLVILFQRSPGANVGEDSLSPPQYRDILEQSTVFEELAMMAGGPVLLRRDGPAEMGGFVSVSSSFLGMLGAKAHLGRLLTPADDEPGAPFANILTYEAWQHRYGADPNIVGKTIPIEHGELEVVGVLEPGFLLDTEVFTSNFYSGDFDVIVSMPLSLDQREDRTREVYGLVGKLKPGVSEAEAQAELDVIAARMLIENPPTIRDKSFTIDVVPLLDQVVGRVRSALWMLLIAASLLLLIACTNVGNLMLARSSSRRHEFGICAALGAGRAKLAARLLTESLMLASAGAAFGLGLAWASISLVRRLGPVSLPRLDVVGVDGATLVAALVLAMVTSVVAGTAPAWFLANVPPKNAIAGGSGARGTLRKRVDASTIFVVTQVAVAFLLMVGAGLVSRSFASLLGVNPGFKAPGTLSIRVAQRIDNERRPEELLAAVRAVPGVTAAAMGNPLPFAEGAWWAPVDVEGYEPAPDEPAAIADWRAVSPDYFNVMGIPVVAGRAFEEYDLRLDAAPVRIVDQRFAEKFWPGESAIGKRIHRSDVEDAGEKTDQAFATVVGVVHHVRHHALETDGRMTLYMPAFEIDRTYLLARTEGDPETVAPAVGDAIRTLDPDIGISNVRSMEGRIDDTLAPRRLTLAVVHGFGWLALVLATVGLFGLIAYGVAEGKPEIGIRIALGATRAHIRKLVLRQGLRVIVLGLGAGLWLCWVASGLVASFLYEVEAMDVGTYVAIALLLALVTLLASWVPAVRASRVDPRDAMRQP